MKQPLPKLPHVVEYSAELPWEIARLTEDSLDLRQLILKKTIRDEERMLAQQLLCQWSAEEVRDWINNLPAGSEKENTRLLLNNTREDLRDCARAAHLLNPQRYEYLTDCWSAWQLQYAAQHGDLNPLQRRAFQALANKKHSRNKHYQVKPQTKQEESQ